MMFYNPQVVFFFNFDDHAQSSEDQDMDFGVHTDVCFGLVWFLWLINHCRLFNIE